MRNFVPINPHGTAFAPKHWLYQKDATCMESSKLYCPRPCRKRTYKCRATKYPVSSGLVSDWQWKYAKFRSYQPQWYCIFTKAMVISKGSYVYRELKNVLTSSVEEMYLPVSGHKILLFMDGRIGPRMEICKISCLPIFMVPHFHRSNGYIKGKLPVWRAKKCIALVGAENVLTSAEP